MKNSIFVFVAFFFLINASFATVRTVSNSPFGGAQYNSLWDAYVAASNNDTLLLEGTDIPYFLACGNRWEKNLVVIGIGFNPQKQNPRRAKIRETDCWGEFRLGNSADGTRFYGIEFNAVATEGQVLNFLFEGCKFNIVFDFWCFGSTGFVFRNCVFDRNNDMNIGYGGCGAVWEGVITNCIFDGYIEGSSHPYTSLLIDHCIFLKSNAPFNNVYYAQVQNCVFVNFIPNGAFNSEFNNNLCRVSGALPPQPANGNTGTANIENADPLFVSYAPGAFYSPAHDYDVQPGSPAIATGSDGTDIGIHGGASHFSETGEVLITPILRSVSILNSSVASNGTLNVQVHAAKPNVD
jgi:hypothetical protein